MHSHITQAGSHRQWFRPCWGSTAWHGHWSVTGETCVQSPFTAEVSPLSASSTQHMWELLAQGTTWQLYHNMSGEGRSRVWCMCALFVSDLYHMFTRKQCILCPALRHGCLTLLYVTSTRDFFYPWNNCANSSYKIYSMLSCCAL